jgi:hypothetical protein
VGVHRAQLPVNPAVSMQAASPAAFAFSNRHGATPDGQICKSSGRGIRRYDGEFAELVGSLKMKGWREPIIARGGMVTAAIGKTVE